MVTGIKKERCIIERFLVGIKRSLLFAIVKMFKNLKFLKGFLKLCEIRILKKKIKRKPNNKPNCTFKEKSTKVSMK